MSSEASDQNTCRSTAGHSGALCQEQSFHSTHCKPLKCHFSLQVGKKNRLRRFKFKRLHALRPNLDKRVCNQSEMHPK